MISKPIWSNIWTLCSWNQKRSPAQPKQQQAVLKETQVKMNYLQFLRHFLQCRTIRLWYFLLSMHHVDSPWIDSIVFVTFWNFLSKVASKESPEAAPAPAAMSGGTRTALFHSRKQMKWALAST